MKKLIISISILLASCGVQSPETQAPQASENKSSEKKQVNEITEPTVMKTVEGEEIVIMSSHFAMTESELPVCDDSRDGFLYFISSTKTFKGCDGIAWQVIDTRGEKGDKGDQGEQGEQGIAGPQGEQGVQGAQGVAGIAGTNGTNGVNGTNGTNGTNGVDGSDGQDGQDGTPWKVYAQDGTALFYYLNNVSFSDTQYNEEIERNTHGVLVRSLTTNEYTIYKTTTVSTGIAASPDNGQSWWPNPVRYRLYSSSVDGSRIYFTGSNCTGTAHIRVSSGGSDANNSTKIASSALAALALPNTWVLTGEGNYEIRLVSTTANPSGAALSVITPSGCSNVSLPSSNYREVVHRAPQFASSLGLGWYVDQ